MKRLIFLFFLLQGFLCGFGQEKLTINGYIKDSLSGETLIGANIVVRNLGKTVVTNSYGFFSITLPKGKYQLNASFIGYQTKELRSHFQIIYSKIFSCFLIRQSYCKTLQLALEEETIM
jgi:hypothetical protein